MALNIALAREQQCFVCKETVRGTLVWPGGAVKAQGTITMGGVPIADETFVIGAQTYTWKALRAATGQVTIGVDAAACVTNIVAAVTLDQPLVVTAADGAGNTVVITAVAYGIVGNTIVFTENATNMTVNGAGFLGTTTAGDDGEMVPIAGPVNINQNPSFTDSPEIVDTRDVIERFQDMMPPGEWSCSILARPYGAAGSAPAEDVFLESLMGDKAINAAVSVVYSQALEKPSFTLWTKKSHTVFFCTGATVSTARLSVTNKGAVTWELSGQFMQMGFAGTDALAQIEAAGQSELTIDNAKKFSVGARIWNVTAVDDNGGAGYEITDVNATTNVITVSPVLPAGGWAENDVIEGFLPAGKILGDPIESRYTSFKINAVAAVIKSLDLTISDPAKYMDDEITTTGYVTDYVEDTRSISGTLNLHFRIDNLAYFYDAINSTDVALELIFGNAAGSYLKIDMAKVNMELPVIADAAPVVDLNIAVKALGTDGEDSMTLTYY